MGKKEKRKILVFVIFMFDFYWLRRLHMHLSQLINLSFNNLTAKFENSFTTTRKTAGDIVRNIDLTPHQMSRFMK